jgi:hypothetical protein
MKSKVESRKSKGARRCAAAIAGLFLFSSLIPHPSSLARAAHPFLTDDAGTQGAGNWQLELMAQRNRHESIADPGGGAVQQLSRAALFNPVLTYGLLESVDLAVGLNRLRTHVSENGVVTQDARGWSDSTVEAKWRFYDADGLSFALKPGISLPTGDETRGLGLGRTSWGVSFIADYDVKPWAVFGNVAYFHPRFKDAQAAADNRSHLWRVSAGTTYEVRENLWLAGELGVRTNEARNDPFLPGGRAQYAMVGLIFSPAQKIDIDVGVRKALNRAETDTVFLVGATLRW